MKLEKYLFASFQFALAALVLTASLLATTAHAQEALWRVSKSVNAEVLEAGKAWRSLETGVDLRPEMEIRVGPGGQAVLEKFGDVVTLSPNSHIKVPAPKAQSSMLQKLGTLLFNIRKRDPRLLHTVSSGGTTATSEFKVDTPYLAAVIKGTVFTVNVSGQGAALHVTEGLVEAISLATGERGLVSPGQTARVTSLPGAGLTISHGGKVNGKSQTEGNGNSQNDGNNGANGDGKASDTGKANGKGVGRGLSASIGGGVPDVAKSSKGLLKAAGVNAPRALGRASVPGQRGGGNGVGRGRTKTPGQLTAGLGGNGVPGTLPNGKTPPGGGGGNGNGNGNGNNGCNGNGKKPGC